MKELRQRHGWSAQKLGEEMTRVGVKWDRSIVANFENGRRPYVTVVELFALAYLLDVAPVHLLVPPRSQADLIADRSVYAVTPRTGAPTAVIREWLRGRAPIGETDAQLYFSQVPPDEFQAPEWKPVAVVPVDGDGS